MEIDRHRLGATLCLDSIAPYGTETSPPSVATPDVDDIDQRAPTDVTQSPASAPA